MSYYRDTKKGFGICAVCFLLVAVLLCGMMTSWFKDWNPYCWFGHDYDEDGVCQKCGEEKPAEEEKEPDENGGMDIAQIEAQGVVLAMRDIPRVRYAENGISTQAESAKQLTATIEPSDVANKEVDWSVAWKNASSTWATGKKVTDYVTIAAMSDGGLTANVSCLKAFGEQVVVSCTSRENPNAVGTATVDYRARVIGATIDIDGVTYNNTDGITLNWSGAKTSNALTADSFALLLSDHTVEFAVNGTKQVYVQFNQDYVEAMVKASSVGVSSVATDFYAKREVSKFYANDSYTTYKSKSLTLDHYGFFAAFSGQMYVNVQNVSYYVWNNSVGSILRTYGKPIATISLVVPTSEFGAFTIDFAVSYDMSNLSSVAEKITLSSGNLVF